MEKNSISKLYIIGGSSGSLDVLFSLFARLQPLRSSALIIILHRKSTQNTLLSEVFSARSTLDITEPDEKEFIVPGRVYIAPADYHLLVEQDGSFSLDFSEKVNYSRPSIDVTMQTAAEAFGEKVIGILLSGANADGVSGMLYIQQCGGYTIAQDPATAEVDYMPRQAIDHNAADAIYTPLQIADFINQYSQV